MAQAKGEAKILQMIEMIKKEAKEESDQIIADARFKISKEKNKTFTQAYEQLLAEFKERELNDKTQRRLETSRKTNETRLDVQKHRSELLADLKKETEEAVKKAIADPKRNKELLKAVILEGAVRLLEPEIGIFCREVDKEVIEGMLPEINQQLKEFTKKNIGNEIDTRFFVITERYMKEEDIGGVILYCNKYKTVYNNSARSRLDLAFETSIPDIRRLLFPNKAEGSNK